MSEKIPISLHNSDLFLNPKSTGTIRKKIDTDKTQKKIFQKKSSLGENNYVHSFNSSYLLSSLNSFKRISKVIKVKESKPNQNKKTNQFLPSQSLEDKAQSLDMAEQSSHIKDQTVSFLLQKTKFELVKPLRYQLHSKLHKQSFYMHNKNKVFVTPVHNEVFKAKQMQEAYALKKLCFSNVSQNKGFVRKALQIQHDIEKGCDLLQMPKQAFEISKNLSNKIKSDYLEKLVSLEKENNNLEPCFTKQDERLRKRSLRKNSEKREIKHLFDSFHLKVGNNTQKSSSFSENEKVGDDKTKFCSTSLSVNLKPLDKIDVLKPKFYFLYSKQLFEKLNRRICLGVSREWLLVSINLILFSILAVVQRSHSGTKMTYNTLLKKKLPTLTSSDQSKALTMPFSATELRESLEKRGVHEKQKDFVGVFLGLSTCNKTEFCSILNNSRLLQTKASFSFARQTFAALSVLPKTKKAKFLHNEKNQIVFSFLQAKEASYFSVVKELDIRPKKIWKASLFDSRLPSRTKPCFTTNGLQKSRAFEGCFIQPWYCIKACQSLNNKMVATRSSLYFGTEMPFWQHIYNNNLQNGFKYYLPFYKSQEHIFIENDTIPSKRDTVFSERIRSINLFNKPKTESESFALHRYLTKQNFLQTKFCLHPEALTETHDPVTKTKFSLKRSCTNVSEVVLKGFFYKYGLLFVLPSNQTSKLFSSKTKSKKLFTSLQHLDETSKNYTLSEFVRTRFDSNDNAFLKVLSRCLAKFRFDHVQQNFVFCTTKTLFSLQPVVNQMDFRSYLFVLKKIENLNLAQAKLVQPLNKQNLRDDTSFLSSRFSALTHKQNDNKVLPLLNFTNISFSIFAQTRKAVSTFVFISDDAIQSSSVSGYQFPKCQGRDVAYLFRKQAITQEAITKPSFSFAKSLCERKQSFRYPGFTIVVTPPKHAFEGIPDLKMPYVQNEVLLQVDLHEIKTIKDLFKKVGRNYEEYLRQPKDSLPALIISPSLEDDREIEDEGIRIFRKREFVRNKRDKSEDDSVEQGVGSLSGNSEMVSLHAYTDGSIRANENEVFVTAALIQEADAKRLRNAEIPNVSEQSSSKSHQLLVKNALRQAQEEIDNIAKKEEKGTEKDKQVIPPLTRLEALYTIRNREKKYEQAKSSHLHNKAVQPKRTFLKWVPFTLGDVHKKRKQTRKSSSVRIAKDKSLPLFEQLFLYSDKPNYSGSDELFFFEKHKKDLPDRILSKFKNGVFVTIDPTASKGTKTKFLMQNKDMNKIKFCLEDVHMNRKHSFFGEMSLPSKKMTAKEQKQIFQQKGNPLLEVKNTPQKSRSVSPFLSVNQNNISLEKLNELSEKTESDYYCDHNNGNLYSVSQTAPLSLLSQLKKKDNTKSENFLFKIGTVNSDRISLTEQNEVFVPKKVMQKADFVLFKNRIYFYDNLSQNKSCQSATPKVKNTPLQSPILHRVWQPKRMEPSTFRVYQIKSSTSVIPKISQKDWTNMMEWQLKKYFVEEEKRLLPLSLKNQSVKIKKLDFYLPWVHLQKQIYSLNNPVFGEHVVDSRSADYWQLPTQQIVYTTCQIKSLMQSKKLIPVKERNTQAPIANLGKSCAKSLNNRVTLSKKGSAKKGVYEYLPSFKADKSILFELVTKNSWLFIYTFVFIFMFKQLFVFVYKVGLKDFFIRFLNSEFGRTISSEELRYSIQNAPLADFHMPKKRLQDLFGVERNKVQLLEIVWFLRNRCQGRHGVRGVLLVGVPGVENVSVVQAIAGEAHVPIIVQSLNKIAQDSEPQRKLEQLYMRAQKKAPCILFLDQLDTIGARRDQLLSENKRGIRRNNSKQSFVPHSETVDNNFTSKKSGSSGNKLNVVLRLLTILDGITQSNGVVTVATAHDLSQLDPALLRPKRFDKKIYLSLPNQQDRVHLFKLQTQKIGHIKNMPWDYLSLQSESMSAADIQSAINYSLFRAVLQNSVHTVETLEYGIDCVKTLTEKRVKKNKDVYAN